MGELIVFSQTVEYALRAIVLLASQPHTPMTAQRIAERTQVPAGYLSKVLQNLARAELVRSQRGVHGGFVLARSAEELTILDVVNAVDPIRRIKSCPLGLAAHAKQLCPLHSRLDEALAHIEQVFAESSIAEMISDPPAGPPLCEVSVEGESVDRA